MQLKKRWLCVGFNTTDLYDMIKMLSKVALNTIVYFNVTFPVYFGSTLGYVCCHWLSSNYWLSAMDLGIRDFPGYLDNQNKVQHKHTIGECNRVQAHKAHKAYSARPRVVDSLHPLDQVIIRKAWPYTIARNVFGEGHTLHAH